MWIARVGDCAAASPVSTSVCARFLSQADEASTAASPAADPAIAPSSAAPPPPPAGAAAAPPLVPAGDRPRPSLLGRAYLRLGMCQWTLDNVSPASLPLPSLSPHPCLISATVLHSPTASRAP